MFRCLKCNGITKLPICTICGYVFKIENDVFVLSDDPNINLDDDKGGKYIGYDEIGHYYSCKQGYEIDNKQAVIGRTIASIVGDGLLLDLACGDGYITVPAASYGCKIIASDISNVMLSLLKKKADCNNISLENVTLCKMNALDIPLARNSVDFVMANGELHLMSNPKKVLKEIKRVLKKGGRYISLDDMPAKHNEKYEVQNKDYYNLMNTFYFRYWELLKDLNIYPIKYSWKFDKSKACKKLFGNKKTIKINFDNEITYSLGDSFLCRMGGKDFSGPSGVPSDIHKMIFKKVMDEFLDKYGKDFIDVICKEKENGIIIELFKK